jgi:hypothetical protein
MHADIDMSGRIEETNRLTAIALANGVTYCIRISARDKRAILAALKKQRPERRAIQHQVLVFSTLLFFLIRDHVGQLSQVRIDLEYPTYEASIKEHILNLCRRYNLRVKCDITFGQVGKKSPAHEVAIQVYRGKARADRVITASEVLKELN